MRESVKQQWCPPDVEDAGLLSDTTKTDEGAKGYDVALVEQARSNKVKGFNRKKYVEVERRVTVLNVEKNLKVRPGLDWLTRRKKNVNGNEKKNKGEEEDETGGAAYVKAHLEFFAFLNFIFI